MSVLHEKMKNAFIEWVVPDLVMRGFRGVFPNYRRYKDQQIDIISLHFGIFEKIFCVEIAKCPTEGITYRNGDNLPGDLVTAKDCPRRFMLGTKDGAFSHWFQLESNRFELMNQHLFPELTMYENTLLKYKKIAGDIVDLIEIQAEPWWQNSVEWWHHEALDCRRLFFDVREVRIEKIDV